MANTELKMINRLKREDLNKHIRISFTKLNKINFHLGALLSYIFKLHPNNFASWYLFCWKNRVVNTLELYWVLQPVYVPDDPTQRLVTGLHGATEHVQKLV